MPVTPMHLIAGIGGKALFPSLDYKAFAVVNILIDIEPALAMLDTFGFEGLKLHGPLHSFLGAFWVAFAYWGLMGGPRSVLYSAMAGGFSHIFLDMLYHSDMRAFAPLSSISFAGLIPPEAIDWFCIVFGLALPLALWKHCRSIREIRQAWSTGPCLHRKTSD